MTKWIEEITGAMRHMVCSECGAKDTFKHAVRRLGYDSEPETQHKKIADDSGEAGWTWLTAASTHWDKVMDFKSLLCPLCACSLKNTWDPGRHDRQETKKGDK